ncbi:Ig-like domain-containing protein, partial [Roseivirga echinicomitans]|uniref:Ig-like domain-containing protein n=1 Tax=Roseivirga echinicomitans TaxID=296218 RepID=UPI000A5F0109
NAGNIGASTTDSGNFTIDTKRPTVAITIADAALKVGETTLVTFTFSEVVTGFANADITIPNGTMTAVSSADGGTTYTATFTPTADLEAATNVFTVANTGVTDNAGNIGAGTTDSGNFTIDTKRPTVVISTIATSPNPGAFTATFTFSDAVTNFVIGDITVSNGAVSNFNAASATVYTATITPVGDGITTVDVAAGKATDASSNSNTAATQLSITNDETKPTINISIIAIDDVVDLLERSADQIISGTTTGIEDGQIATIGLNNKTYTTTVVNNEWSLTVPKTDIAVINTTETVTADVSDLANNAAIQATRIITRLDASIVTAVAVPLNKVYNIGDRLDLTVTFNLAISTTGTPSIPITIGASMKTANLKAAVSNSNTAIFSYTITEGDLDNDGIALGTSIDLNGGTIQDSFGTDALLNLNQVASTAAVLVDGVSPTATLTTAVGPLTNIKFEVNISFEEIVTGFAISDIQVTNGTASNLVETISGKAWTVEITPGADGTVTVGLPANNVTDAPGNANKASSVLTTAFDATAPTGVSITRKDSNPVLGALVSFRATFSEDVTGVDLTDFEVILTGTATGTLNTVTQVDAKTYDISLNGISGEGTIGLNLKNDQSIVDTANNPLSATFTGEVYMTNLPPTDITISSSSITENNQVAAVIGSFTTIDADQSTGHIYSLVTGTGSTDNAQFIIDGPSLKTASVFDFETKTSYSIRVKTDDGRGGAFEKVFTITITNVEEPELRITSNIDIPVTDLGLTSKFDITIHNDGEAALVVNSVLFPEGFIGTVTGIIINPSESRTIDFGFKPMEVKIYAGTIQFITNAGTISVDVSGEGAIITGVDDGEIKPESINVFPNPANRIINIDLSELGAIKLDVEVVDISGTPMFSRKAFTERNLQLDVSEYNSGIYVVQFSDGRSVVRKKVMIKK